ncbi:unnamed protein product [Cyprideis torosa]|uniref:Uncharacterized protein n=1 Tax=Cyprideis torosa TaxID=163714 RepID=A0A7R8ZIY2_9CRUS|nr:unnamed protein product [Cyprideis torosa]CAG0885697.1 unnamed protein product [Cyprideis torosa]
MELLNLDTNHLNPGINLLNMIPLNKVFLIPDTVLLTLVLVVPTLQNNSVQLNPDMELLNPDTNHLNPGINLLNMISLNKLFLIPDTVWDTAALNNQEEGTTVRGAKDDEEANEFT